MHITITIRAPVGANKLEFPRWIGPFHENYFVTIFSKTLNRSPVNKGCWLGQVSFPPRGHWVGLSCLSWRTTREQNFACSTFSQEATVLGRASSNSSCLYFQSKILLRGPFLNLRSELAYNKAGSQRVGQLGWALPATNPVLWPHLEKRWLGSTATGGILTLHWRHWRSRACPAQQGWRTCIRLTLKGSSSRSF